MISIAALSASCFVCGGCSKGNEWEPQYKVQEGVYISGSATKFSSETSYGRLSEFGGDGLSDISTWISSEGEFSISVVGEDNQPVSFGGKLVGQSGTSDVWRLDKGAQAMSVEKDGFYRVVYSESGMLSVIPYELSITAGSALTESGDKEIRFMNPRYDNLSHTVTWRSSRSAVTLLPGEYVFSYTPGGSHEVAVTESSYESLSTELTGKDQDVLSNSYSELVMGGDTKLRISEKGPYVITVSYDVKARRFYAAANAILRLPDQLGDHGILQQYSDVNIWGWAAGSSNVRVSVSWSDDVYETKAGEDGSWMVSVKTMEGGYDPQTITVSDDYDTITLQDVLIGEVWLAGGQSNMELPLSGFDFDGSTVEGGDEALRSASVWAGKVREVKIQTAGALKPARTVPGIWEETNPETAKKFTAVGWYFATKLNSLLDVPVGILSCNRGGSALESWLPEDVVRGFQANTIPSGSPEPQLNPDGWYENNAPYVLYNGMLSPISNYTVKGFLWYQGETNAFLHQYYAERLSDMVGLWRGIWKAGNLPFYEVELTPHIYQKENGTIGARIREAQHKAVGMIRNCGIVVTNDLIYPDEKEAWHPRRKKEVGERLASLALNRTYGISDCPCEGPAYGGFEVTGSEVKVYFENLEDCGGLACSSDTGLTGFEIAGSDRKFYPATAELSDGYVVVRSRDVNVPVAVRYCFRDFLVGNLTGGNGLPAAPFRSDNWDW